MSLKKSLKCLAYVGITLFLTIFFSAILSTLVTSTSALDNFCKGDVNGDYIVNIFDLAAIGLSYGSIPGTPNWNENADFNNNSVIDIFDLAMVGLNYNKKCIEWSEDIRLSNETGLFVAVTTESDNVHVVWEGMYGGVFYKRSINNGYDWEDTVKLVDSIYVKNPKITSSNNGILHLVWEDFEENKIYYKKSLNQGNSWSEDFILANVNASNYLLPMVITDNNEVYVIWTDHKNIFFKKSENGGENWNAEVQLTNYTSGYVVYSAITLENNNVHVVWTKDNQIFYKKSTNRGENWTDEVWLTEDNSEVGNILRVLARDNIIHLVWDVKEDISDLYISYKKSLDGGDSWIDKIRLTNTSIESLYPTMANINSSLYIFWTDIRDNDREIYYKISENNGDTWGKDIRLTYAKGFSGAVEVSLNNNIIHLVWQDNRDDYKPTDMPYIFKYEIYYKRGIIKY